MQTAQVLAGYSLGDADLLRRAMGKKKVEEMDRQKVIFLRGSEKNDIPQHTAAEIFDLLAKFAGYGFNKSHSAAYGLISYQTAWLKAHYRAEYMAAVMSIESGNTDKVVTYINDCRRADIQILPPDVQESLSDFDVPSHARGQIRFGLAAVKNVGETAVETILKARTSGRFKDFSDFLERVNLQKANKRVLEHLIRCGAFDWTGLTRHAMNDGLDGAMRAAQRAQEQRSSGQVSLFGGPSAAPAPSYRFPDLPEWPTGDKLSHEKESLGFFISGHPMDAYGDDLKRHITCSIDNLSRCEPDQEVVVAGMVTTMRTLRTRRGDRMAFATLEDQGGSVECLFFADAYQASREALGADVPLRVKGQLQKREDEIKLKAESAERLADVLGRNTHEVRLYLDLAEITEAHTQALSELLERHKGNCRARIWVSGMEGATVVLDLPPDQGLAAEESLRDSLEVLFRRSNVVRFL